MWQGPHLIHSSIHAKQPFVVMGYTELECVFVDKIHLVMQLTSIGVQTFQSSPLKVYILAMFSSFLCLLSAMLYLVIMYL